MRLSLRPQKPCTMNPPPPNPLAVPNCSTLTQPSSLNQNNFENLLPKLSHDSSSSIFPFIPKPVKLANKWREYQGIRNWDGLLDPLDDNLRNEILRYGQFVEATYNCFDFDTSSPSYATCRYPKSSLFGRSGLADSGYRITKNLRATSGINLPHWIEKMPSWVGTQSGWIGYVAVCQDKEEIARLGRRDIVIAFRGTATCLEWVENLRATLTDLPGDNNTQTDQSDQSKPMVESGFLSLYSSGTSTSPSLQNMVRDEIYRLLQSFRDEPISLTITGHSLGAALAILTAFDIKTTFKRSPLVTVIPFGGPRVGNESFRKQIENQGTKILRIVNSDDVITKVPGFVLDDDMSSYNKYSNFASQLWRWIQKRVAETQWIYSEVGQELRLSSKDSPYINRINVAACHELKTYLHLVDGFVSSRCPFKATCKRLLSKNNLRAAD